MNDSVTTRSGECVFAIGTVRPWASTPVAYEALLQRLEF